MRAVIVSPWMLLGLLLCGCVTPPPVGPPAPIVPNPFLEAIVKAGALDLKATPVVLKPDGILKEIPLKTPLADAQVFMKSHGFSCWDGIQENYRTCLYCMAYQRKNEFTADKIVVRFYHEKDQVDEVYVTVEYGVARGFWPSF